MTVHIKNPADPRHNRQMLEMVKEPLSLNWIYRRNDPGGIAGAKVWEYIINAMAGKSIREFTNSSAISERRFVHRILLEP